jgi:hypothetical protein
MYMAFGHDHDHGQGMVTVTVMLFTKYHGTVRSGTVRYEKFTFTRQERNFHCIRCSYANSPLI